MKFTVNMNIKFITLLLFLLAAINTTAWSDEADVLFPNLVISKYHYNKLKEEIAKPGTNRMKMCYIYNVRTAANNALNSTPNPIVSLKKNPNNVNVSDEMTKIYNLCVAYLFSSDQAYLDKAVAHLTEWAKINVAESKYNINESVYTKGVEGYSVIRSVIGQTERTLIDNWVIKRTNLFIKENDLRENNWGTCLMYQIYSAGLVLNEPTYINWFKTKYAAWVKNNLFPNGTTTDLLARDAFAYHAYDLSFFGDLFHAIAMYEGYKAADEFYNRDVNWGATLKKCVHFWIPFMLDTEKHTHIEFTNTEYSPDLTRTDANKPFNPAGHLYAFDKLYEMDNSLSPAVAALRGNNPFATWALALGGVRWEFGDGE